MPWIKVISLSEAKDLLRQEYEAALKRAGRIWNIVSIMWSQSVLFVWSNHGSLNQ